MLNPLKRVTRTLRLISLLIVPFSLMACDISEEVKSEINSQTSTDSTIESNSTFENSSATENVSNIDGDSGGEESSDTGNDSGGDSGSEEGSDTGNDTGNDIGGDLGGEEGSDTGNDIGGDSDDEEGSDTGNDIGGDSDDEEGSDTGNDSGGDSGDEEGSDTGNDSGGDSGDKEGSDTGNDTGGDSGGEDGSDTGNDTGGDSGGEEGSDTGNDSGGDSGSEEYSTKIFEVPGAISAEDFSAESGIQADLSSDTPEEYYVGWINNNDYTEYQIEVVSTGEYIISARVSSKNQDATINISADSSHLGAIAVSATGQWDSWQVFQTKVNLSAGKQTLRLTYNGGSSYLLNLNELTIEEATDDWTVSTLADLRAAIQNSDQIIVMKPGDYLLSDLPSDERNLQFSGSNNTVDLTGVYVEVPVGSTAREPYIFVDGGNNTINGGEFEDIYVNGMTTVTDFISYNNDGDLSYGLKGYAVMSIGGNDNLVDGIKLTVRGSFPYGYGSIFGIGAGNSFGLNKRCGIFINGQGNTIDHAEVQQRAFCHGIYMQEPADDTTIRNTLVEGRVRETNDMLAEGIGSLPYQADYLTVDDEPIASDEVNSLAEDGIRAYSGAGSVIVENSVVKKMRGGIRLYLASSATVSDSTAIDCGATNWNMPKGSTVTNSSGNFTYAPLSDFRLSKSNQTIEMTILPSPDAIGSHNIADILGNNHTLTFHREDGPEDSTESRSIIVYGNNSTITNETEYQIILSEGTSGNTVMSAGVVIDNGDNNVTTIDLEL